MTYKHELELDDKQLATKLKNELVALNPNLIVKLVTNSKPGGTTYTVKSSLEKITTLTDRITADREISNIYKAYKSKLGLVEMIRRIIKEESSSTKSDKIIQNVVNYIKDQTGLTLKVDNSFGGLKRRLGMYYFSVIFSEPIYMSQDYSKLQQFANKYDTIKVSENGQKRAAIHFNKTLLDKL